MQGTQKLLKVAKLMVEASFTHNRRETELKTEALKVEQELAKAQTRVKVLDKENEVDQSKAVISSGTEREEREREKKVWLNEELHKNISSNDSKEHHGIQNCNTFQEPFHYKEVAFKRNYPARSTSDARNYTLVNEIWLPDPTVLPSQDIPAENLLYQSRDKKVTTSHRCMVQKMDILLICFVHLLENKQLHKLLLNSLMEIH